MEFTCDKCQGSYPLGQKRTVVIQDKPMFKLCINCLALYIKDFVDWLKKP